MLFGGKAAVHQGWMARTLNDGLTGIRPPVERQEAAHPTGGFKEEGADRGSDREPRPLRQGASSYLAPHPLVCPLRLSLPSDSLPPPLGRPRASYRSVSWTTCTWCTSLLMVKPHGAKLRAKAGDCSSKQDLVMVITG